MSSRINSLNLKPEQRQCISHENGNLIISASAGSGKTFVMINRLVRLIAENKTSVDRILATTFTESAAADMKRKLYEELLKEYKESKDQRLVEQIDGVFTSDISTIHTFCSKTLKRYFYVAGVSPDFKIAAEDRAFTLLCQAVDSVLSKAYKEKDANVLMVIKRHLKKRSDAILKELLIELYDFAQGHANPEEILEKSVNKYSQEYYLNLLERQKQEYNNSASVIKQNILNLQKKLEELNEPLLVEYSQEVLKEIDQFLSLTPLSERKSFRILAPKYNPKGDAGEYRKELLSLKDDFLKIAKEGVRETCFDQEESEKLHTLYIHAQVITGFVRDIRKIYSNLKREENLLDFNDLEHFTLKVLENQEIREEIKNSYDYICIDEYQDVNDVQEKLAQQISRDNLFMVGDVKQSIYGFRGCRSDFFEEKYNTMQKVEGQAISLNYNFRSSKKVIDMVNQVFNYCMEGEVYGFNYSGNAELTAGGVYPEGKDGRAEFILIPTEKKEKEFETPRIYDVLEEYSKSQEETFSATGAMIKKIIDQELLNEYYDFKEKTFKPVTYSDIAVLTRNRGGEFVSNVIAELSAHGIPVVSTAKEDITAYKEIKILLSVLELISCFSQDIPLVAVLKSPIGLLTDEELAKISLFNKNEKQLSRPEGFYKCFKFYIENANDDLSCKLKQFKEYFDDIRYLSSFTTAKSILSKIQDKNLLAYYYATFNGDKKVKRIKRFLSFLDAEESKSVEEVLYKIKNGKGGVPFSTESGGNAVNFVTMHSSKGLEYPVVIVCGIEKGLNYDDIKKEVYKDEEFGYCFKFYDDNLRVSHNDKYRLLVKDKVKKEVIKEATRLFYVALTRAKYSLYVVGHSADERNVEYNGAKRYLDFIPASLPCSTYTEQELKELSIKKEPRKIIISKTDGEKLKEFEKRYSFIYQNQKDTTLSLKTSVTGAISLDTEENYVKPYFEETTLDDRVKERGITAHKFLELLDFTRMDLAKQQADEMVASGLIEEKDLQDIELDKIINSLSSPIFSEIADKKLYKEKSFLAKIPARLVTGQDTDTEILVQGVIDLLAVDNDSAIVIDYKYSGKDKNALKATYQKQLDLYSIAIEQALNVKVVKKAILSLKTGEIVEID